MAGPQARCPHGRGRRVRRGARDLRTAYDADYAVVGHAKKLADSYGVSGTNGADATLVLKRDRGQENGILHVTGRDVDESEHTEWLPDWLPTRKTPVP